MGLLFLVLLPMAHQVLEDERRNAAQAKRDDGASEAIKVGEDRLSVLAKPQRAVPLMIVGGVITQSGRVFADAHWFSDVLAGSLLGSSGALCCLIAAGALFSTEE